MATDGKDQLRQVAGPDAKATYAARVLKRSQAIKQQFLDSVQLDQSIGPWYRRTPSSNRLASNVHDPITRLMDGGPSTRHNWNVGDRTLSVRRWPTVIRQPRVLQVLGSRIPLAARVTSRTSFSWSAAPLCFHLPGA